MTNPYAAKSPQHFWKLSVAEHSVADVRPIPARRFEMRASDAVATAGSCFAQHVSAHLKAGDRVRFLEAEIVGPGQPSFSALYGNIYTARQLVQLMDEALGHRHPSDIAWRRSDGAYVDALRPSVFPEGFPDPKSVVGARASHCAAVRWLLSSCTVFIFTLGLTETWRSTRDGTVYPLAPGVMAEPAAPGEIEFHNFSYEEVLADLEQLVARLGEINPGARLVLTVSPVPLTATYGDDHVLIATAHSKAVLRAAAGAIASRHSQAYYFPSYEIITGNYTRGRYFEENLRTISPEGVAQVMRIFELTYGLAGPADPEKTPAGPAPLSSRLFSKNDGSVLCDEPEIVKSLGF